MGAKVLNGYGIPGDQCKARWRYLRNYFTTIRNQLPPSGSAYEEERDKVKWTLYRPMEFLLDTLRPRKSVDSIRFFFLLPGGGGGDGVG